MSEPFAAALGVLFAGPLAQDVTYYPGGGPSSLTLRAVVRRPDATIEGFAARVRVETLTVDILAADLADPAAGDEIDIGTETRVVQGQPTRRDSLALVWSLDTRARG